MKVSRGSDSLAVVIPYFKIKYLKNLLTALCDQDDKSFTVYIGDDCSPESPTKIIKEFDNRLNIIYYRFASRMGNACLAGQWNRCLKLCKSEQWVWVIPDDDFPSKNCISAFRSACRQGELNLARVAVIPLAIVDAEDNLLLEPRFTGDNSEEDNYTFYIRQLAGDAQGSSLGENIFHKASLLESGGFVPFPKGWGSDHATINLVSAGNSIRWLSSARFYFRQSGENISSQLNDAAIKMHAKLLYAMWLKKNQFMMFGHRDMKLFYRLIYLKGEHYYVYIWRFSFASFCSLVGLRFLCIPADSRLKSMSSCFLLLIRQAMRAAAFSFDAWRSYLYACE